MIFFFHGVLRYILPYVYDAILYIVLFDVRIGQDLTDNTDDNIHYDCLCGLQKAYVLDLNYILYY